MWDVPNIKCPSCGHLSRKRAYQVKCPKCGEFYPSYQIKGSMGVSKHY